MTHQRSLPAGLHTAPAPRAGAAQRGDWLTEGLALAAAFLTIFVLMQAWAAPLTGWSVDASQSAILRNGFLPAYALVLGLAATRPMAVAGLMLRSPLLMLLTLLTFVSAFWSIDPDATLRRAMALAFTSFAGLVIAARWNWRTTTELLAANFAVLAVASLALAVLLPAYGQMQEIFPGAWRGLWLEKNALGGVMSLGAVICAAAAVLAPRRRGLWVAVAALCLFLTVMSTSRTSLVSSALGFAAMGGIWMMRRGRAGAVALSWAAVVIVAVAGLVLATQSAAVFELLGKDATLTGRTEIWTAALRHGREVQWTGFGYGVLWDHKGLYDPVHWIWRDAGFVAGHAHNSWLEVWLGLGFIGLALWTVYFLEVLGRSVVSVYQHPGAYLALPFVLVFLLRTITEVSVLDYHDGEWTFFVMVATLLAVGWREPEPSPTRPGSPARRRAVRAG